MRPSGPQVEELEQCRHGTAIAGGDARDELRRLQECLFVTKVTKSDTFLSQLHSKWDLEGVADKQAISCQFC